MHFPNDQQGGGVSHCSPYKVQGADVGRTASWPLQELQLLLMIRLESTGVQVWGDASASMWGTLPIQARHNDMMCPTESPFTLVERSFDMMCQPSPCKRMIGHRFIEHWTTF